ncbi:MAG TPA: chromosomal replication initiator protein DnaA, partial [Streptosporangiaceae bacterium]
MTNIDLAEVWARSLDGLGDLQIQPHQRAWLKLTRPLGLVENTALIATPNEFVKEQLETRLRALVTQALSQQLGRDIQLAVTVDPGQQPQPPAPSPMPDAQLSGSPLSGSPLSGGPLPNAQAPNAQAPNAQLPNSQLPNGQLPGAQLSSSPPAQSAPNHLGSGHGIPSAPAHLQQQQQMQQQMQIQQQQPIQTHLPQSSAAPAQAQSYQNSQGYPQTHQAYPQ